MFSSHRGKNAENIFCCFRFINKKTARFTITNTCLLINVFRFRFFTHLQNKLFNLYEMSVRTWNAINFVLVVASPCRSYRRDVMTSSFSLMLMVRFCLFFMKFRLMIHWFPENFQPKLYYIELYVMQHSLSNTLISRQQFQFLLCKLKILFFPSATENSTRMLRRMKLEWIRIQ